MKPHAQSVIHRRSFLKTSGLACAMTVCPFPRFITASAAFDLLPEAEISIHPAQHFEKLEKRRIRCALCPRKCEVDDLERGYCGVRENRDGDYYTLVYGRPCTLHVDPVEKKPFFHFLPGTEIFSLATVGCNVNCKFCQNWQISQIRPEQERSYDAPPKRLVELAKRSDTPAIAHTYTEPVIFYEYVKDIGREAHQQGLKNVIVSNGYILETPLIELFPFIDAVKIDLKAFTQKFYTDLVLGELKPILDTLVTLKKHNIWTEIVYLVIPTYNDSPEEIRKMCRWIVAELGRDIPIHFSRFHPQYMLKNLPPTPVKTLDTAFEIAHSEGINYAYIGNVPGSSAEHTTCPSCNKILIKRSGYQIEIGEFDRGTCLNCGTNIPGVWE